MPSGKIGIKARIQSKDDHPTEPRQEIHKVENDVIDKVKELAIGEKAERVGLIIQMDFERDASMSYYPEIRISSTEISSCLLLSKRKTHHV